VSSLQDRQTARMCAGTTAKVVAHAGGASAIASLAGGARTAAALKYTRHTLPDGLCTNYWCMFMICHGR